MLLKDEARKCRREAARLAGRPEAPFLLQMAQAFEELATRKGDRPKRRKPPGAPSANQKLSDSSRRGSASLA